MTQSIPSRQVAIDVLRGLLAKNVSADLNGSTQEVLRRAEDLALELFRRPDGFVVNAPQPCKVQEYQLLIKAGIATYCGKANEPLKICLNHLSKLPSGLLYA